MGSGAWSVCQRQTCAVAHRPEPLERLGQPNNLHLFFFFFLFEPLLFLTPLPEFLPTTTIITSRRRRRRASCCRGRSLGAGHESVLSGRETSEGVETPQKLPSFNG
jgi:hypothetical protein